MLFKSLLSKYCFFDGNDLGKLGNIEALPSTEEVSIFKENFSIKAVLAQMIKSIPRSEKYR
jgi:hypothetical protein